MRGNLSFKRENANREKVKNFLVSENLKLIQWFICCQIQWHLADLVGPEDMNISKEILGDDYHLLWFYFWNSSKWTFEMNNVHLRKFCSSMYISVKERTVQICIGSCTLFLLFFPFSVKTRQRSIILNFLGLFCRLATLWEALSFHSYSRPMSRAD